MKRGIVPATAGAVLALSLACPQSISELVCTDGGQCPDASLPDGAANHPDGSNSNPDGSSSNPDSGGNSQCTTDVASPVVVPQPTGVTFQGIQSLAFGSNRNLYVLCTSGTQGYIVELSPAPDHAYIKTIGQGTLQYSYDFALDTADNIYVVDYDSADPSAVGQIVTFAPNGSQSVWFDVDAGAGLPEAYAIATDSVPNVYIGGSVVWKFTPGGTFIGSIGSVGCGSGLISWPIGLTWDPRGYVWVADLAQNSVEQWHPVPDGGGEVIDFGGPGIFDIGTGCTCATSCTFWGPTRLALDSSGNVYANDPYDSRLLKFDRTGTQLGQPFTFGGSKQVGPIVVEPSSGNLYVGRGTAIDIVCPW